MTRDLRLRWWGPARSSDLLLLPFRGRLLYWTSLSIWGKKTVNGSLRFEQYGTGRATHIQ